MQIRTRTLLVGAIVVGVAMGFLLRLASVDSTDKRSVELAPEPSPTPSQRLPEADRLSVAETPVVDNEPDSAARNPLQDMPDEVWHPRDKDEWQGMLVNTAVEQYCEASNYCGLALACNEQNVCGACSRDSDCASGEACVLDHCVVQEKVACRTRHDCTHLGEDALCLLSGLTGGDTRGNADMTSYCQLPVGGQEQVVDAERIARREALLAGKQIHPEVTSDNLFERLRAEPSAAASAGQ